MGPSVVNVAHGFASPTAAISSNPLAASTGPTRGQRSVFALAQRLQQDATNEEVECVHATLVQAQVPFRQWLQSHLLPGEHVLLMSAPIQHRDRAGQDFLAARTEAPVAFSAKLTTMGFPGMPSGRVGGDGELVPTNAVEAVLPCKHIMIPEMDGEKAFQGAYLIATNLRLLVASRFREAAQESDFTHARRQPAAPFDFSAVEWELGKRSVFTAAVASIAEESVFHTLPLESLRDAYLRIEQASMTVTRAEMTLRITFALLMLALGTLLLALGCVAASASKVFTLYILVGLLKMAWSVAWLRATAQVLWAPDLLAALRLPDTWAPWQQPWMPSASFRYGPAITRVAAIDFGVAVVVLLVDLSECLHWGRIAVAPLQPDHVRDFNYAFVGMTALALVLPRVPHVADAARLACNACCKRVSRDAFDPVGAELKQFQRLTRDIDLQPGSLGRIRLLNARLRRRHLVVSYDRETFAPYEFVNAAADGSSSGSSGGGSSTVARAHIFQTPWRLLLNLHEETPMELVASFLRLLHDRARANHVSWQSRVPAFASRAMHAQALGFGLGVSREAALFVSGLIGAGFAPVLRNPMQASSSAPAFRSAGEGADAGGYVKQRVAASRAAKAAYVPVEEPEGQTHRKLTSSSAPDPDVAPAPLPAGWEELRDEYGQRYYVDPEGTSTWTDPRN